jgi:2-polyprenyl-3-methyl-5-hydroxy-6-metoxy-1,4-benzoquinol methylase
MKVRMLKTLERLGLIGGVFKIYEYVKGFDSNAITGRQQVGADGLPLPPAYLRMLVAGTAETKWFLHGGQMAVQNIGDALARVGKTIEDFDAILDFGCGCGRVTRQWASVRRPKVYGTDYNPTLLNWCKHNLPFAQFALNASDPPLPFNPQQFDFVYALSVFTHLPEAAQFAWMDEMLRVIKPGGYLLFSTHGENYLKTLEPDEVTQFQAGKLVSRFTQHKGTNLCSVFHPESYTRAALTRGFEMAAFVPRGAVSNGYQDLNLFHKPG